MNDEILNNSREEQDMELLNKLEIANKLLAEDAKALQSFQGSSNTKTGNFELGHSRQNSISSLLSILSNASSTVTNNYSNDENSLESLWSTWGNLIADWDNSIKKKSSFIRDLTRKGIPEHFRGLVWQHLSGTKDFEDKHKYCELLAECSPFEKTIRRDITRTFPDHHLFKVKNGDGQESLFNVMKAYSLYDREVGYCQGSCFIAGLLLMHMPEEDAFCVLARIMSSRYNMRELFKPAMTELGLKMFQLECMIQDILPDLYNHMQTQSVSTSMFASSWFLTIFATVLPLSVASRVMDVFLSEGVEVLFRVGITLLQLSLGDILSLDMEETIQYLQKDLANKVDNDGENLIGQAFQVKYNARKMKRLEKEYTIIKTKEQEEQVELRRLRTENKLLTQRIENLEKETEALADRLVQSQVKLAQREEDILILKQKRSQPINYVLPQLQIKPIIEPKKSGLITSASQSDLNRFSASDSVYINSSNNELNRITSNNEYLVNYIIDDSAALNSVDEPVQSRCNNYIPEINKSFDDINNSFSSTDYDLTLTRSSNEDETIKNNSTVLNVTVNPILEQENCTKNKLKRNYLALNVVDNSLSKNCCFNNVIGKYNSAINELKDDKSVEKSYQFSNNRVSDSILVSNVKPVIRLENLVMDNSEKENFRNLSVDIRKLQEEKKVTQNEIVDLQNELISCKLRDAESNLVVKQLQCKLREIEKQWQKTCSSSEPGIAAKELAILGCQLKEANTAAEIGDLRMRLAHAEQERYVAENRGRCTNEENTRLRLEVMQLCDQNILLRNQLNEVNLQKLDTELNSIKEKDLESNMPIEMPIENAKNQITSMIKSPLKNPQNSELDEIKSDKKLGQKFEWLKYSSTV